MPTESKPISYAELKAFVTNQFSDDYTMFASVTDSTFRPSSTKMGHTFELPDSREQVDRLLARLPILQAQSQDPDEEGDLPVSDEAVEQMRRLIGVLAGQFTDSESFLRQSSLSANPAGDLEISWRFTGNTVLFIAKSDAIVSVVKKAGEESQRHVLNGTVAGSTAF